MSRPIATRSFLFTDIEGSTRRWQADATAMSAALARHDAVVRSAIEAHGGEVFKTVGDAFCAAFERASDAVAAAVELERAVSAEDWSAFGAEIGSLSVRAAVHSGEAETRDGDWFGRPLNRAARLLAVGHGGQVLASRAVEALVADALPPDVSLRDLGRHRLKDLAEPEHVFQVLAAGLARNFPALASVDARPNNLPVQLSSFIGRDADINAVRRLLEGHRLVTLTGIGGAGKTRLALQVAAEVLADYPDGAWFVDLVPVVEPTLVPETVAVALGVRDESGRAPLEVLFDHLARRRLLLVLDNCEHVVHAAADFADAALRRAPDVRIVATSRQLLGAPGEHVWPVPPLDLPELPADGAAEDEVERARRSPAVQLFVERAVAGHADFRITAANAGAVAGICHRLDGIPLAIELAAARVRHLDPAAILARLDDRFHLLTSGSRTAPSRQQTLRAALDWSHDLLDERERALLRRLAIFRGGWTLEAAETVCADHPGAPDAGLAARGVLDSLGQLADQSLVVVRDAQSGGTRYGFLESIRQYAKARLVEAGEVPRFAERHLDYFEALTAEAEKHRNAPDASAWLDRLDAEIDNLRAALERVVDGSAPAELGFRAAGRLWWMWVARRASKDELLARLEALVDGHREAVSEEALAPVLYSAGLAARHCDRIDDAQDYYEQALDLARANGQEQLEAWCHNDLGNVARSHRDFVAAEMHLRASLAIKERLGTSWDVSVSLKNLGYVAFYAGDMDAAYTWFARSVEAARQDDSAVAIAGNLADLAYLAAMKGELGAARAMADESSSLAEDSGDHGRLVDALESVGLVALLQGRVEDARAAWAQELRYIVRLRVARRFLLAHLSRLAVRVADPEAAARLAGAFDASPDTGRGLGLHPRDRAEIDADLASARSALGDVAWDRSFSEGQSMELEQAYLEALAWLGAAAEPLEPSLDPPVR